jgi:hypothetical protein
MRWDGIVWNGGTRLHKVQGEGTILMREEDWWTGDVDAGV